MSLATDLSGTYTASSPQFGTIQITVDDFGWVTGVWNGVNWSTGSYQVSVPVVSIAPGSFAYYSKGDGLGGGANYLAITGRGTVMSPSSPGDTWNIAISVLMYREVHNGTSTGPFTAVVTLMRDDIGNAHQVNASTITFTLAPSS